MICVARKARRVSSKLWHGRKDDEIWASGTPSCQARFGRRRQESLKKASIRDSEKSKYCSSGDRPNPGEPNVVRETAPPLMSPPSRPDLALKSDVIAGLLSLQAVACAILSLLLSAAL